MSISNYERPLYTLTVREYIQLHRELHPETKPEPDLPEFFDINILEGLGIFSKSTIYKRLDEIPHYRTGGNSGRLMFNREEIFEWLKTLKVRTKKERLEELQKELLGE